MNPGLFLSADLSSFVPHKWTHLIDFLSTWITSIAVNMGRQIPRLPRRWGCGRTGAAARRAQHARELPHPPHHPPCASPRDSAELLRATLPSGAPGRHPAPAGRLWAWGAGTWGLACPSWVVGQLQGPLNMPTSALSLLSRFLSFLLLILCDSPTRKPLPLWSSHFQP